MRAKTAHVVLAEGDTEMRHILATVLREEGHEVVVARNAAELAEHLGTLCLERTRPDLIVGDVRMPSGRAILESLCADPDSSTPVILIAPLGDRDDDEEAIHSVTTIDLPLDVGQFRATLQRVLGPVAP